MELKNKDTLPDTLGALLAVAVEDLEKVIVGNEHYRFTPLVWHRYDKDDNVCNVCLAGAVMAGSLGADPYSRFTPCDYATPITKKLDALDSCLYGKWQTVFSLMNISHIDSDIKEIIERGDPIVDIYSREGLEDVIEHLTGLAENIMDWESEGKIKYAA